MPDGFEDVRTFAQRIKQTYPDYSSVDDYELVSRIATKYPDYKSRIKGFDIQGADELKLSPAMTGHYLRLYEQFEKAGIKPFVKKLGGFRTAEDENYLFRTGHPTMGNTGYGDKISPHQEGRAIDFSFSPEQKARGRQIIAEYARQYGLHIPSTEPWHIALPKGRDLFAFDTETDVDVPPQQQGRVPEPPTVLRHKGAEMFELTPKEKARLGVPTMQGASVAGVAVPTRQPDTAESFQGGLRGIARLAGLPTQFDNPVSNWINEAAVKGGAGLTKMTAGVIRSIPRDPFQRNDFVEESANRLNSVANEISQGAMMVDRSARRGFLSQTAQDVLGGTVASAPAMALVALGVPAPVAFGLQSYLDTVAEPNAKLKDILLQTGKGVTIGALFALPVPVKLSILGRIGYRVGTVGGGTGAIELATGADTKSAATSALVNSIFAATGELKARGMPEKPITEPRIDTMPDIPDVPVGTISEPRIVKADSTPPAGVSAPLSATSAPIESPSVSPQREPATTSPLNATTGSVYSPPRTLSVPENASASQVGEFNPSSSEGILDSGLVSEAQSLRGITETKAFREQGLGGLDVESQRLVMSLVLRAIHNPEIRERVVKFIPIDVVNRFVSAKLPPEVLLHDPSVLPDVAAVNLDNSVSFPSKSASAIVRVVASAAAKETPHESDLIELTGKANPAMGTSNSGHDTILAQKARTVVLSGVPPQEAPKGEVTTKPVEASLGDAIPKDANLTEASQNGSTIYFEFDAMRPMPTAEQMKAALSTEGAQASVVRYEPNIVSGARGTVRFRADIRDADGRMSSSAAENVYKKIFGTKDRISGDTTLSGILTPEEQFKLGVGVSKAQDFGTPISDPRVQAARIEATKTAEPIAAAIEQRASQFAALKEGATTGERHALDLTDDLKSGLDRVSVLKQQGVNVLDTVNADESLTPFQRQVTQLLDHDPEIVGRVLDNYLKSAELIGSPQEKAFFEKNPPTKDALLEAAMREAVRDANKEISVSESEGLRPQSETSGGVPNIDTASKPASEGVPQPDRSIETGSPAEAVEGVTPQNLGPGAANINEPFAEVKERSFGKQLMADERLVDELKESLGTSRYYEPIPNNLTAENAREFVDSRGVPEAMKAIRDETNGMPFHVRVAAGEIAILRLNEAVRNLKDVNPEKARFALDQATEASEWAMDYGTRLGQGVQAFAMWKRLMPEGKLNSFKRAVDKARTEYESKHSGEVQEILDTVNQEGLTHEQRIAELTKLFGKNKTAKRVKPDLDKLIEAAKSGNLTDKDFYNIVSKRLGLPDYTPEVAQRIVDLGEKIDAAPEGLPKDKLVFELNKFIAEQNGFSPWDLPMGIYYANILSGYNTNIVNTVDTALNVISEVNGLALNDPRAGAQIYAGLIRGLNEGKFDALNVLTTGRMITDGKWLEVPRLMEIAKFGKKGGVPIRTNTAFARTVKATAENPLAYPLNAYKYATRLLAASDAVFYRGAKEARSSLLAYRMAEAEGLTGDALINRMRETLATNRVADFRAQAKREGFTGPEAETRAIELQDFARDKDVNSDAADFAGEATYNHDPHGMLGYFSKSLATASQKYPELKLFVPFTRIVANVTNRGLNYTPLGFMRARGGFHGEWELTPEQRRLMITRATLGTAGLVGMGVLQQAGLVQIHGNGPSDTEKRRQMVSAGWKPYSLQIGDNYISYIYSPVGLGLSIMGNWTDSRRYHELEEKDAMTRASYAAARIAGTIFSQSFLSGLSRLFEALSDDPGRQVNAVKNILSTSVGAFATPNIVRDVARLFDNKQYQSNTFMEDMVRNTPFASLMLRPNLNAFGEPVELPRQRFFSELTTDPAWQFVIKRGLRVPVPGRNTELKPGKRLTAEQHYSLLQTTGPQLKRWIIDNQLRLSGMTEDAAQDALSKEASRLHSMALDQMEPSRLIMRSIFRGVPRPPEMASPSPPQ